jgi:hypothetical protein
MTDEITRQTHRLVPVERVQEAAQYERDRIVAWLRSLPDGVTFDVASQIEARRHLK